MLSPINLVLGLHFYHLLPIILIYYYPILEALNSQKCADLQLRNNSLAHSRFFGQLTLHTIANTCTLIKIKKEALSLVYFAAENQNVNKKITHN